MSTTMDNSQLQTPIDAMHFIHKALRAEAERVEEAVNQLEMGGSFKPFQRTFYRWAMALSYHVGVEDAYLMASLVDPQIAAAKDATQQEVMTMLENLQAYLHEDLGRMIVIPRTQRQLRSRVIALSILQEDLLEEEEEQVLPVLRAQWNPDQQLELIRHLLIDEETEEPCDMLEWMIQDLTDAEQHVLTDLRVALGCAAS